MAAAQTGDAASYRRLLHAVRPWLKRYFALRLPPAIVEDAVQETLIAFHEKRHTYEPGRPIEPWLGAIARYKWIDRLRAMKRAPTEPISENLATDDHELAVVSATVLERLLAQLRPAQAECIRLVKIRGFSIEEASARTGQSASLVKINIHRGLARLAQAVQRQAHADG
ncbi:MAG: sigma-70 family RNA polymerase sigma factor [Cupriavidus sp.]|nr:MAG: sigma-70 family RNA polymerase sigma factor [Cupriavidus sp.]